MLNNWYGPSLAVAVKSLPSQQSDCNYWGPRPRIVGTVSSVTRHGQWERSLVTSSDLFVLPLEERVPLQTLQRCRPLLIHLWLSNAVSGVGVRTDHKCFINCGSCHAETDSRPTQHSRSLALQPVLLLTSHERAPVVLSFSVTCQPSDRPRTTPPTTRSLTGGRGKRVVIDIQWEFSWDYATNTSNIKHPTRMLKLGFFWRLVIQDWSFTWSCNEGKYLLM